MNFGESQRVRVRVRVIEFGGVHGERGEWTGGYQEKDSL